jgi:hypothetical protein
VILLDSDTTNIGTNGFYLPFDGSAPIGQDQSGRGNNWTPVNFGGSNTLEKATGALPILNTDGGGKVARVGVRTDSSASSLVLALPLVGIKSDFSNKVNSGTTEKVVTVNNGASASSAQSNFYGGSFSFSSGSSQYLTVNASSDFNFGTSDWTMEAYVYMNSTASGMSLTDYSGQSSATAPYGQWYFGSSGGFVWYHNSTNYAAISPSKIPATKWFHLALVKRSGTLYHYLDGVLQASQAHSEANTGKSDFNFLIGQQGSSSYWNGYIQDFRIYKGLAKYTSNFIPASTDPDIVPDSPSGVSYSSNLTQITDGAVAFDGTGDYLSLASSADFDFAGDFTVEAFVNVSAYNGSGTASTIVGKGSNSWIMSLSTSGVLNFGQYGVSLILSGSRYVPTGSWTHIAVSRSGSTIYGFINGVLDVSATSSANFTNSNALWIGSDVSNSSQAFNGTISNVHVVKGTALYTANFTPPTGPISSVANTKLLCCKSNSSATAFDVSPGTITANGNAAATNFNPFTVNINTQRGKQSGYCTLNPLDVYGSATFSNGNLTVYPASGSGNAVFGSLPVTSGKWYWEVAVDSDTSAGSMIGITDYQYPVSRRSWYSTSGAQGWLYYADGSKYTPGNPYTSSSYGSSYTTGAVIGVALDMNAGTCTMYKNNVSQGTLTSTGLSGNLIGPALGQGASTSGQPLYSINFGQKPFKFPPPAGFQPLTLANTPRPTIVRPDQFVGVSTYSGTGAASRPVTNLGFKPDFVWIKNRSSGSYSHQLFDSVRGASAGCLYSDLTNAQDSNFPITSFDTSGFTLGSSASLASQSYASQNGSGSNYVAWAWKAGGNSNTFNINDVGYATASAAGLTAGTITPTGASVNTKSGFSIIKVPGTASAASFSHGLGQAPAFVILKETNGTGDWQVGHKSLSSGAWTSRLGLNLTTAEETTSSAWNNTPPTSSLITVGATSNVNNDFIVYAWAEIPGFSKFGSYTGNGSSDGPVIITGFSPRWLLIKRTDASNDWWMWDTARSNTGNPVDEWLSPNRADAEYANDADFDFLSNGFKIRTNSAAVNASGGTYIYACWAETPSFNLYGAMSNAR